MDSDHKAAQSDMVKLIEGLRKLAEQNPTPAKGTGIDDFEGVILILGRIVNDAEKRASFAEFIGYGFTEVLKDAITKSGTSKPTPVTPPQTAPGQLSALKSGLGS